MTIQILKFLAFSHLASRTWFRAYNAINNFSISFFTQKKVKNLMFLDIFNRR